MNKKINAFILAAGLGERLKPITNTTPKPLLPILGKPMLQLVIEKMTGLPVKNIAINLHYMKDEIQSWISISGFRNILLFPEADILGTGGALKNAEQFLDTGAFIVHNSDIISDIDIERLISHHFSSGNIATLAVHDYPKFNNVVVDDNNYIIDVENPGTSIPNPDTTGKKVAYTGIGVYSPEILNFLPYGISHTTEAWIAAAKAGHKVQALDFTGCYWNDIGTPASYASAILDMLRVNGETVYIHPTVKKCSVVDMNGHIVIESKSILTKGSSLKNCIMLPGSKTEENKHYENCIFGPGFLIDLNEHKIFRAEDNGPMLIGTGGSDREYYRIKKDHATAVMMKCRDGDIDYLRHVELTRFFQKHGIPVPEIYSSDPETMTAVFEDLGDISLYSWLKCHRNEEEIEDMYRKVLEIAIQIHTKTTEHVSEGSILEQRIFNYEHFRWETDYFIERFVKGIKKTTIKNLPALQEEFHVLASKADSYPKTIIHRDFQSQNIMIHKGIPRVIDYQGSRIGPPAYDIASILWDPYSSLKETIRESLTNYYTTRMKEQSQVTFNQAEFTSSLKLCRLQRHMQALGAYGFLSSVINKKYFLKHVPEGLRLLKEDVALIEKEYPALHRLVMIL